MVVKAEKHGSVSCRAFNAIVATFSQIFPCLPLSCSFFILIIFRGMVRSVALNCSPFPMSSALPGQGGVLPWTGPLAQHIHRYGLPGLSPLQQPLQILLSFSMGGKKDLDVIVAPSHPFFTTSNCKVSFNYPRRVLDVSVHKACLH